MLDLLRLVLFVILVLGAFGVADAFYQDKLLKGVIGVVVLAGVLALLLFVPGVKAT